MANGRKRKNIISSLSIQGHMVNDFGRIKDEAIRFIPSLYKKGGDKPRISNLFSSQIEDDVGQKLEKSFSVEGVQTTICSIEKDKSPGPDGFSILFYQEC